MKKLLSILGGFGLTATGISSVVACSKETEKNVTKDILKGFEINSNQTGETISKNIYTFMIATYDLKQDLDASKIATYQVFKGTTDITNVGDTVTKDDVIKVIIKLNPSNAAIANDQKTLIDAGFTLGTAYTSEIKVTDFVKKDVSTVNFPAINNLVVNNTTISSEEVTATNGKIENAVQMVLNTIVQGTLPGVDYDLDTTTIKPGDLSAGVKVKITSITTSSLLISDKTKEIDITFTNIVKIDISSLTFANVNNMVVNNLLVTAEEVSDAIIKIKDTIQAVINKAIEGTMFGTDYDIDTTTIVAGDLSTEKTINITVKAGSKFLTVNKTNTIKTTFTNIVKIDISSLTFSNINYKVVDNKTIKQADIDNAKLAIRDEITKILNAAIADTIEGLDYTLDTSNIVAGDLSDPAGVECFIKVENGSKLLVENKQVKFNIIFSNK